MKSIIVIKYCLFVRRRHVGMADDADSNLLGASPCGFKSHCRHYLQNPVNPRFSVKSRVCGVFLYLQSFKKLKKSGYF